jgi:acetyl/propionyl-CoA carboxylase alpha subunit
MLDEQRIPLIPLDAGMIRIRVSQQHAEVQQGLADLIREQVLIAAGEPLWLRQEDVRLSGHAIECRINAEDPSKGFLPAPGRITGYSEPGGPGVRVDSGVEAGSGVVGLYDPLVAKLCVHGVDREHARRRMLRALHEYRIEGVSVAARLPPSAAGASVLSPR